MTRSKPFFWPLPAVAAVLFLVETAPGSPPSNIAGDSCDQACPQTTTGWQLYTDPSRVPDFWWRGSLDIDELLVCPHGIHFLFVAELRGQEYLMALILIRPSVDLARERPKREWLGLSPEAQAAESQKIYTSILERLGGALGQSIRDGVRLDFRSMDGREMPVLTPWSLTLRWRGREIPMKGYLDLYITLVT